MAFLTAKNIRIAGLSAAVPRRIEEIAALTSLFSQDAMSKFTESTGVRQRHVSDVLISSDLCVGAANQLLSDIRWDRSSVDGLVVVTQCPDYIKPANSTIVQNRLGLPKDCVCISLTFGCSGWVYGFSVVAGLLNCGCKRVLLCCGEGMQAYYKGDASTYPLFGAAGTCTAFEYDDRASPVEFHMASDGSQWKAIYMPDGGFRNLPNAESFSPYQDEGGIWHVKMSTHLSGMDVFMFGITEPVKSIKRLCQHFGIDYADTDYILLHQANRFLNGKIAKKLQLPEEKCPHNIEDFGNTSSSSIPLLMATRLKDDLAARPLDFVACAFGIGLSWGSVHFKTDRIVVSDLVLMEDSDAGK